MITLTKHERSVLDHVLIIETPKQWVARNFERVGEEKTREWLDKKVRRWEYHYLAAKVADGDLYRDAKWNYAYDTAHQEVHVGELLADMRQQRAAERASIKEEIIAELMAVSLPPQDQPLPRRQ